MRAGRVLLYRRYRRVRDRWPESGNRRGTVSIRRPDRSRVAGPRRDLGVTMPGNIQTLRRMRLSALAQVGAGDSPATKPELTVGDIRAYPLREPVSRRAYTALEVRTKGGLTGYGECPAAPAEALALAKQATLGHAATSYEVISRQLAAHPGMQAAVVMALLDIVARYAKAPLYQIFGGPTRNKARALAALSGATDADLAEQMKRAR